MINKLKLKSEFTRNVLTLMIGTVIAQVFPIAISPILTRLYTPEDFGILALFMAITSILGTIANGRYELAIMLPRKDENAINIFALGFIINIVLSSFIFLFIIIFHDKILELLNNKEISSWLYFIPLSVFLIGCFNLLNYFNIRLKNYKDLAKAKIYSSVGLAIIQLSLGFFKTGALGLVSGYIVFQILLNFQLMKNLIKKKFKINKRKIIILAKKYKNFPKYSMSAGLINTISLQLPLLILSKYFEIRYVGMFALSNRVLSMPMSLIGNSIGQVFFQKASTLNSKELEILVIKTIKKLFLIGVIPFSIILVYGDLIFSFLFGKNWIIAGYVSQMLSLWLFIVFCVSPVSVVYDIKQKQKEALIFNIMLIIGRVSALIFGAIFIKNFLYTVALYVFIGSILWLGNLWYILSLVNARIFIFYKEFFYFLLITLFFFLFREVLL